MNVIIKTDENKLIQRLKQENEELIEEIGLLKRRLNENKSIKELQEEIVELKERLKNYRNPSRNKSYYVRNRDKILQRSKERYHKSKETKCV
jgi:hypothetical protein